MCKNYLKMERFKARSICDLSSYRTGIAARLRQMFLAQWISGGCCHLEAERRLEDLPQNSLTRLLANHSPSAYRPLHRRPLCPHVMVSGDQRQKERDQD